MHSPKAPAFEKSVRRALLVRLRSIGDTVLMTPCLTALKEWRPEIEIDVLIESLSAPILRAHPLISRLFVLPTAKTQKEKLLSRLKIVTQLRSRRYDAAFNLHGGTTAAFLTRLAGAQISVGYNSGRYSWLLSERAPTPESIWRKDEIHCVEQQLALLKWMGVPVSSSLPLSLAVDEKSAAAVDALLKSSGIRGNFAAVHPAAAFPSKQWEAERFARLIDYLHDRLGLPSIVVVGPNESAVAKNVMKATASPAAVLDDLDLSELTALISKAALFIGNDSGPAHIAAAFRVKTAVIFGSSNWKVWRPWSQSPFKLLRADMPCAPCPGYFCSEFAEPECIKRIAVDEVIAAIDELTAV